MDVQGAELLVLKGFGLSLKAVKVIILETSFTENYVGGSTFSEIYEYLSQCGFRLVWNTYSNSVAVPKMPLISKLLNKYNPDFNCLFINDSIFLSRAD